MTIKVTYNITDVYMSQSVSPVYITVSYAEGGSGGGAVWGAITGTLSNQTDLQNALNAKFDDPTGTTLQYIDGTGALQTFPLTLPVLQEVRNQTGATLDAGTVVYINGATGNKPTVTKAIATGDATSAQTLGMISSAIANNGVGYVVVIGTCGGLDTSAFTEGQQLYLSGTVAGGVTTTKPYAPIHLVYVGIVTRAHPTLGTVEVRVQNGFEMDEIHNVSAQTPSNNDGLFYNTTTSLWESKAITTALGYTPVPTTRNITINGVTYDLSADRTYTISTGISGSGASGQVTYWTGASAVSGSNNLFWDNANGRLGIGTNAPAQPLHIIGSGAGGAGRTWMRIQNTNTGSGAGAQFINGNNRAASFQYTGSTYGTGEAFSVFTESDYPITFATNGAVSSGGTSYIAFSAGGYLNEAMRITGTKNLLINTTTDGGQRLQVYGDTLLRGSGATNATTALTVQNSSSTNLFTVRNDGNVGIGVASSSYPLDVNNTGTSATFNVTARFLQLSTQNGTGAFASDSGLSYRPSGNQSAQVLTFGINTGQNIGGSYLASNGNTNIAGWFAATVNKNSAANIGIASFAVNNGTSPTQVAGYFALAEYGTSLPTFTNAAIVADNGATTSPIFIGRDNGSTVFTIVDGGNVGIGNTPTAAIDIKASTTSAAAMRFRSGTAPTTPNDGDIWFDGTDIKMRIGGVTKTFTLI